MRVYKNLQCDIKSGPLYLAPTSICKLILITLNSDLIHKIIFINEVVMK
jgi:hypothetical protein